MQQLSLLYEVMMVKFIAEHNIILYAKFNRIKCNTKTYIEDCMNNNAFKIYIIIIYIYIHIPKYPVYTKSN